MLKDGGIASSMHRQQTFRCALTIISLFVDNDISCGRGKVRRFIGAISDADNFPTCAVSRSFVKPLYAGKSLNKPIRNGLKTASFKLSATSSGACGLKTDFDPRENRSFGFSSVPAKARFWFRF